MGRKADQRSDGPEQARRPLNANHAKLEKKIERKDQDPWELMMRVILW